MLPGLNLDNDTFENLIEEYRNRIAGIYPDWTDYNYHDPGMTLLELFAWLRENQQYFMEQLSPAHYREFFRLAGFQLFPRQPARVLAEVKGRNGALELPSGTLFLSGGLPFETVCDEYIPDVRIVRAECFDEVDSPGFYLDDSQLAHHGAFRLSPFGYDAAEGSCLDITVSGQMEAGRVCTLAVTLADIGRNPYKGSGSISLVDLKWEYRTAAGFRDLTILRDETCGLLYSGRIAFRMDKGEPATSDGPVLRVRLSSGGYDIAPVIIGLSFGQIELMQIRSHSYPEGLELADGNGFPDQEYWLPQENFIASSVRIEAENVLHPGNMIPWNGTVDLFSCSPDDLCFEADETTGTVRFGDGWHGMPPEGRIVLKEVKETAGAAGNVREGAEFLSASPQYPRIRLGMIRTISAGKDPESVEALLLRILEHKDRTFRAVTLKDYERIIRNTPGLCIHSCHAWSEESDQKTVHVAIRPGDGKNLSVLSEREKAIITEYLDERRLIGTKIVLHSPRYIRVDIHLETIPSPRFRNAAEIIEQEIRDWFEEKKTVYGEPLQYSDLFGRIDRLSCVRSVRSLSMNPQSTGIRRSRNRNLIAPVNGIFLPGSIEVVLNHYQTD